MHTKIIEPEVLAAYDPDGLSCFNLNTPEEYRRACDLQKTFLEAAG
jgi:hypothetical protein